MIMLKIAAAVVLLYLFCILAGSFTGFRFFVHSRQKSSRRTLMRCLEGKEFPPEVLELPWENEKIFSSRRNSTIAVWALAGASASDGKPGAGTIILLHGLTWDHHVDLKYAVGFIERGWNVVMVDLPGHGDSLTGRFPSPSFGYHEKYDVDTVVDWTHSRFPGVRPLILAGESMGASTALQYIPLGAPAGGDKKIDGIIADCPYTSVSEEGLDLYKRLHIPAIIRYPSQVGLMLLILITRGYSIFKISPFTDSLSGPTPILFIHGSEDHFVPAWMSVRMAEARKQAGLNDTALVIIDGAGHAKSVVVDPERWFREAFAFIDTYCRKNIRSTE